MMPLLVASAAEAFQTAWGGISGGIPLRHAPRKFKGYRKVGTASSSGRSGRGTSMRTVLGSTLVPESSQ